MAPTTKTLCAMQPYTLCKEGMSNTLSAKVFGIIQRETDRTWFCIKDGKRVRKRKIVENGRTCVATNGLGHQPAIIFNGDFTMDDGLHILRLEDKNTKWFYVERG